MAQQTQEPFGPLSVVRDGSTGEQLAITNKEGTVVAGPDARYTAAQLSALAAAGGLTLYATYVASDTGTVYRATDPSTLVADRTNNTRRWCTIGDSIAWQNTTYTVGPPVSVAYQAKGWLPRLLSRLGWPAIYSPYRDNIAVGGVNTEGLIAAGGPMDTIIAQHATTPYDRCFIHVGTNDPGNGLTFARITTALTTLFTSLHNVGITPVYSCILPRGADVAMTSNKRMMLKINAWAFEFAQTYQWLEVIDAGKYMGINTDAFGNIIANMSGDSLHPADLGAEMMAEALYEYYAPKGLSPVIRTSISAADIYHETENPYGVCFENANPLLLGTGGSPANTPDGMQSSGGVWTKGTQALPNGTTIPTASCALAATATHYLYDKSDVAGAWTGAEGIAVGDVLYGIAVVKMTGTTGVTGVSLKLQEVDGTTTNTSTCFTSGTPALWADVPGSKTLTLVTPDLPPVRPYSGSGTSTVDLKISCNTSSGGGTFEVLRFELRKRPVIS